MLVVFCQHPALLKQYLDQHPLRGKGLFYFRGVKAKQLSDIASGYGLTQASILPLNDQERDNFINQYDQMIALMSVRYHSKMWWATDMASKNRFKCKLVERLQEFCETIALIRNAAPDSVLILNCSVGVIESLPSALAGLIKVHYQHLGQWRDRLNIRLGRLKKLMGLCRATAVMVYRWAYASLHLKGQLFRWGKGPFYVIKSFVYDHSFNNELKYRDVFFGSLPDHLSKTHQVLIFVNILGNFQLAIKRMRAINRPMVPIEACLTLGDIIKAFIDIVCYAIKPGRDHVDIKFNGLTVNSIVWEEYALNYKGIQIYQLLHEPACRRLLSNIQATHFLLTTENNPWELMCLWAINGLKLPVRTVGYQHTIVPQACLNMFPAKDEIGLIPLPSMIYTVGNVNREIMLRYGAYNPDMVKPACALRFEYLQQLPVVTRRSPIRKILLALEGVIEAAAMVSYVIKQLEGHADIQMMVRTHPTLPWIEFEKAYNYNLIARKNFILSPHGPLKDDLMWADAVIYWGSTVGLEAIAMGLPIINYTFDAVVDFDPVIAFDEFKWTVTDRDDLLAVIKQIEALRNEDFVCKQRAATAYMKDFFHPINESTMSLFDIG